VDRFEQDNLVDDLTAAENEQNCAAYSTVDDMTRRYENGLSGASETEGSPGSPNIINVFIERYGYIDMSCSRKKTKTEHLESLGVRRNSFQNFYVNSPICSPSRVANERRGKYPFRWKISSYLAIETQRERAMAQWLDPAARVGSRLQVTTVTPPSIWQMAHGWATRCRNSTVDFRVRF